MDLVDGVDRAMNASFPAIAAFALGPGVSHASVAASAAVVFGNGVDEILPVEIGPEFGGDVHLGVADLPE